ncbi:hypothetical protein Tco_0863743 [Tanacetum coccineum]
MGMPTQVCVRSCPNISAPAGRPFRKEERSLINTSFLGEYECSSLALEREGRDEKKRLDHLKQDQEMLVIKIFSERKKTRRGRGGESFWEGGDDFGVDVLRFHTCLTDILGFLEKLEWWFEQDIDDEED